MAWQRALPEMDDMNDAQSEDLTLIRRIVCGQKEALEELYAHHRLALFGYVLGICPDRETAEEILQDTLLAAWRSASTYQGQSSLRAWLLGVARRQAHNTLRQRALPVAGEAELAAVPSCAPGEGGGAGASTPGVLLHVPSRIGSLGSSGWSGAQPGCTLCSTACARCSLGSHR